MSNTSNTSQGKSLLDTYLDYHNLVLRSTTSEPPKRDGMPFMPMLLMDAMYLLYEDYVKCSLYSLWRTRLVHDLLARVIVVKSIKELEVNYVRD